MGERRHAALTNCSISGNYAGGNGGGLFSGGTTTLTDCTVSGNYAHSQAGGLGQSDGTLALTNCTVSGNSTNWTGGGLWFESGGDGSTLALTNCTVSGNSSVGKGGGLYLLVGRSTDATLTNTIVAGQKAGVDVYGAFTGSHDLIGALALLAPWATTAGRP